jgi:hypothetical protein
MEGGALRAALDDAACSHPEADRVAASNAWDGAWPALADSALCAQVGAIEM